MKQIFFRYPIKYYIVSCSSKCYQGFPFVSAFSLEYLFKLKNGLFLLSKWSVLILTIIITDSSPIRKQNPTIFVFLFPNLSIKYGYIRKLNFFSSYIQLENITTYEFFLYLHTIVVVHSPGTKICSLGYVYLGHYNGITV